MKYILYRLNRIEIKLAGEVIFEKEVKIIKDGAYFEINHFLYGKIAVIVNPKLFKRNVWYRYKEKYVEESEFIVDNKLFDVDDYEFIFIHSCFNFQIYRKMLKLNFCEEPYINGWGLVHSESNRMIRENINNKNDADN